MEINDTQYQSYHEVGHAMACLLSGGDVEIIELINDINSVGLARAKCNFSEEIRRIVACGGFATEYLLFKKGYIEVSEKVFIDAAFNNAILDRQNFFGGNFVQENGRWPENMDKTFMNYAIYKVVPLLNPGFSVMGSIVNEVIKKGKLDYHDIHSILNA